eukprot:8785750-Pyramimonas_sp.AAC.1
MGAAPFSPGVRRQLSLSPSSGPERRVRPRVSFEPIVAVEDDSSKDRDFAIKDLEIPGREGPAFRPDK